MTNAQGRCGHPDCFRPTRELKPFCTTHLNHQPYVQQLVMISGLMRDEIERAKTKVPKVEGSLIAPEVQRYMEEVRAATAARVSKDCGMPFAAAVNFLKALHKAKVLRLRQMPRSDIYFIPGD